jgi:hypothetical protein
VCRSSFDRLTEFAPKQIVAIQVALTATWRELAAVFDFIRHRVADARINLGVKEQNAVNGYRA